MNKHNQDGAVSGVVISLVFAILLLLGAIGFGAWAYTSRQDYKDNVDAKVSVAEEAARKDESIKKDKQFVEDYKKPLKTYIGPDAYGSLVITYPKTWSGYVDDTGTGNATVDGYFAPGIVPSKEDKDSVFALRVQIVNQTYSQTLKALESKQEDGKLKAEAYALPKLPKVVGVKVTGELDSQKTGTMVILPLRSQTLQIWTEGTQYLNDYNNNILPNFSFSP
ncbi:MAG: hypothetical protein AAB462_04510 [Patescibacteria group bacterium]